MGKNVVIVVALLAAGFFAAYLRFRPYLGLEAAYTDGVRTYDSVAGDDEIRFAIWDDATSLTDEVNSEAAEHGPAIAPDGELFVFVSGEQGLNADLYVARMEAGELRDARPLLGLNTDFDELAPAFSHNALYFATNRVGGAGGLDIWRSAYDDGVFGEPEPVDAGLNTAADESDPAPLMGTRALAFASDRDNGDWDLYLARPRVGEPSEEAPESNWELEELAAINSAFDDREPSFASNGLGLVLSSDRPGGAGGYDLWRSVQKDGEWLPAEVIPGVGTPGDERSPLSSRDGFTLYYSSAEASGSGDLFRAGSRELFRLPGRPVGWLDLLILGSLVLVALLAWLAKRWQQLEVLYKCFVASVAVHFALLLWFQGVGVEAGTSEFPDRTALFHVRLASANSPRQGLQERGDELATERGVNVAEHGPTRAEAVVARTALQLPGQVALEVAEAPRPDAPARSVTREAVPVHESEAVVAMAEREVPAPRRELAAKTFEHEASASNHAREAVEISAPLRADGVLPEASQVARVGLAASEVSTSLGSEIVDRGFEGTELVPSREVASEVQEPSRRLAEASVAIRQPTESFAEPKRTEAVPMESPVPSTAMLSRPERERSSVSPVRASERSLRVDSQNQAEDVEPTELADSVVVASVGSEFEELRSKRTELLPQRTQTRAPAEPKRKRAQIDMSVRQPIEAEVDPVRVTAVGMDLPAPTPTPSLHASRERPRRAERPERVTTTVASAFDARPESLELVAEKARVDERERVTAKRLERTPYRSRFGLEKERALEEHGGGQATEVAVESGLAYLAKNQNSSGGWGRDGYRAEKYFEVGVGKTGLALLAFLGAGHTPASETQYSDVTKSAVRFLLSEQDPESGHFGYSSSYSHGISTYALAECYALTQAVNLREPLERAVAQILRSQDGRSGKKRGGWGYYYPDDRGSDGWPRVSVSSWQVMALESARLGGLEVPSESFREARRFFTSSYDDRGWFRYSQDPNRLNSAYATLPGSTPAALFALSLMGEKLSDPRWEEALDFISSRAPDGYRYTSDDAFVYRARGNLYFWYYSTLAMFRRGGARWDRWNVAMKETLLGAQESDGSWEPISVYANYAGDNDEDRSYSTAMCVLTLEIYYRYFTPLLEIE